MNTKRLILTGPRKLEMSEQKLQPSDDSVMVKVAAWGICNSEIGDWKGMAGRYPTTIGHEWSGTVIEVGSAVKGISKGDRVTGFGGGGLADYISVKGEDCFRLSPNMNPIYSMCEPLKCVVTVLRAASPSPGDVGVVLGCGPMGLWCIQALAGGMLSALIAADIDDRKLEMAKAFGATHLINTKTTDASSLIKDISKGHMADFVIEGTGVTGVLNQALSWLKTGRGRLTLMSMYKDGRSDFDIREVMNKSAEIQGVFPSYSLNERDDMLRAIALLERGVFNIEAVVSHKFTFEEAAIGYSACENKIENYMKGIIMV